MAAQVSQEIEKNLEAETPEVRVFSTDGQSCTDAFYSPRQDKMIPCTVALNRQTGTITIAFVGGEKEKSGNLSAIETARGIWGCEAAGDDSVAESPGGISMGDADLVKCARYCEAMVQINTIQKELKELDGGRNPEKVEALHVMMLDTVCKSKADDGIYLNYGRNEQGEIAAHPDRPAIMLHQIRTSGFPMSDNPALPQIISEAAREEIYLNYNPEEHEWYIGDTAPDEIVLEEGKIIFNQEAKDWEYKVVPDLEDLDLQKEPDEEVEEETDLDIEEEGLVPIDDFVSWDDEER